MPMYSIRVGTFMLKYTPLKENAQEYSAVDKDGNALNWVAGHLEKGYFINEATGQHLEKAFMLINGQVLDKFSRTKETDKYKEVDKSEVLDLLNPKMYYVECDRLKQELKDSNKALKFGLSFGGKKMYFAYIYVNELYDELFMNIGTTKISEQILSIKEIQKQKEKVKHLTLTIQGIEKASIEQLMVL